MCDAISKNITLFASFGALALILAIMRFLDGESIFWYNRKGFCRNVLEWPERLFVRMKPYSKIKNLAFVLNYPEEIPEDAHDCVFWVDGLQIHAMEQSRGILLRFFLPCSEEQLSDLATFAAGRILREEAVLAWDYQGSRLFLWRELSGLTDEHVIRQDFEDFVDSCEWWYARCSEKEVPQSVLPDILIRP